MRKRQGFTLLEMMVALTIGSMAITSIYFVSSASSRHFREQQQVAQTQNALRLAAERVRKDLLRAGFVASPYAELDSERQGCVSSDDADVQALSLLDGEQTADFSLTTENPFTEFDELRLMGNYMTADEYRAEVQTATQVKIQINNQAFQRSFGVIGTTYSDAVFEEVFKPGRYLRVVHKGGGKNFHRITAVDGTAAIRTVDIDPALDSNCSAILDLVDVAPIAHIQYKTEIFRTAGGEKFEGTDVLTGQSGAEAPTLVRREIKFNAADPIDLTVNTAQAVLEYVADFDVDFYFDQRADGARSSINLPTLVLENDADVETAFTANIPTTGFAAGTSYPHRAMSAVIRLSVRTPTEDERFSFLARTAATEPLARYELNTTTPGAARVRTVQMEVMLPNLAYAGL
ncbi:MAG: prepilin-type N-terminal cleavage/methylation domain-containing protein [Myxococcales bacterium]|nr:prepilin-type N-terminal cleavage/methylation domain-containing protein [Myxococcales bacterium]